MEITDATQGTITVSSNKLTIQWAIKNAKNLFDIKKVGEIIYSPPITDGDLTYYISFFPSGVNKESKNYLSIFLGVYKECTDQDLNSKLSYPISCTFSIKDIKNSFYVHEKHGINTYILIKDDKFPEFFKGMYARAGWIKFLPKKDVLDSDKYFSENGDFYIRCHLEKQFLNFENQIENKNTVDVKECYNCNKFNLVLNNEIFSDVEIIIGNTNFLAHKIILATKSPVFMAILEKDNNKQIIEINGLQSTAVKEMLRYIYTGAVINIEEIAKDLLIAASKYDIEDLKKLCEEQLIKNINIENAIDMIIFAEVNSAKNLKTGSINFTAKNSEILINSKSWKTLNNTLLTLVFQAKFHSLK